MKKLLVILAACAAMTFAFSSCGDEKKESSVNDVSVSEETTAESVSADEAGTAEPETYSYLENADKTPFIGKWECSKLVANGEELTELGGLPIYAVFQYGVNEDGTVELPESLMEISDPEDSVTYTWGAISDNEIEILSSSGVSIIYVLENGQLVNIDNGEEIYLDKVDEFKYFDFKGYYDKLMAENDEQYFLTPVVTDANGEVVGTGEPIPVE